MPVNNGATSHGSPIVSVTVKDCCIIRADCVRLQCFNTFMLFVTYNATAPVGRVAVHRKGMCCNV